MLYCYWPQLAPPLSLGCCLHHHDPKWFTLLSAFYSPGREETNLKNCLPSQTPNTVLYGPLVEWSGTWHNRWVKALTGWREVREGRESVHSVPAPSRHVGAVSPSSQKVTTQEALEPPWNKSSPGVLGTYPPPSDAQATAQYFVTGTTTKGIAPPASRAKKGPGGMIAKCGSPIKSLLWLKLGETLTCRANPGVKSF